MTAWNKPSFRPFKQCTASGLCGLSPLVYFTFFHFRGDRVTWMCHQRNCRAVAVTPAEFDAASALGAVIDGRTHNHKKCPAKAEKLKVQQVFNKGYINQPLK